MILIACLCLLRFIGSWFLFPVYLKCCCFHKSQLKNTSLQGLTCLAGRWWWGPEALSLTYFPLRWKRPKEPLVTTRVCAAEAACPTPSAFEDLCGKWKIVFLFTNFSSQISPFLIWAMFIEENHSYLCYDPCCCISVGGNICACI